MNTAKPFVSFTPTPPPVPTLCSCVDASHTHCLAHRWNTGLALAHLMNGCNCPCHFMPDGTYMPLGMWRQIRREKQRDIARMQALNATRSKLDRSKPVHLVPIAGQEDEK